MAGTGPHSSQIRHRWRTRTVIEEYVENLCGCCGIWFETSRIDQAYCTRKCQYTAYNERKRANTVTANA